MIRDLWKTPHCRDRIPLGRGRLPPLVKPVRRSGQPKSRRTRGDQSGTPAALAAKAATATIPIVFAIGGDPIAPGLVTSLSRPGGNVTGVSFYSSPVVTKRLDLARELVPKGSVIAALQNPENPPMSRKGRPRRRQQQPSGSRFLSSVPARQATSTVPSPQSKSSRSVQSS